MDQLGKAIRQGVSDSDEGNLVEVADDISTMFCINTYTPQNLVPARLYTTTLLHHSHYTTTLIHTQRPSTQPPTSPSLLHQHPLT